MRERLLVVVAVVLLRLPFLNQAIQGDDLYYLYGAQHAQVDPAHPHNARYAFLGREVDMRGHPHPPLNAWILAGLLALAGDIREMPFHAAYIVFSAAAALATLSLARRLSPQPLWATLLFVVTPAFVVSGTSLEADVPFLAFWMVAVALFVAAVDGGKLRLLAASSIAMALAAMTAYQAIVLPPILAVYLWRTRRAWRAGWLSLLAVPVAIAGWQLFERLSTGEFPLAVLAGYLSTYQFQSPVSKLRSVAALTAHLAWLVFPGFVVLFASPRAQALGFAISMTFMAVDYHPLFWISIAVALVLLTTVEGKERFLAVWTLGFFGAAALLFFAGSARYLLPIAAPLAILISREVGVKWLAAGCAANVVLGLALATVNYHHWNGYRDFARTLRDQIETRRVWVNGEWGLRYYLEAEGALPLLRGQAVRPGEIIVTSSLGYSQEVTTGGGVRTPLTERTITSPLPLRLIGIKAQSAWSTSGLGLRPFDFGLGPIDLVKAEVVAGRAPSLEYLPMNAPEAESQIVSGLFGVESGQWRWMGERAVILLKRPERASKLTAHFYLDARAPGRRVTMDLDGLRVAEGSWTSDGKYSLTSGPLPAGSGSATVVITIDKAYTPPGDSRQLGMVLMEVGFRE